MLGRKASEELRHGHVWNKKDGILNFESARATLALQCTFKDDAPVLHLSMHLCRLRDTLITGEGKKSINEYGAVAFSCVLQS